MAKEEIFSDEPPSLFDEDYQDAPQTVDAEYSVVEDEDTPHEMSGLCPKCLDTGFVHGQRNGQAGVLYSEAGQDSSGRPKRRLVVCGHNLNTGY